MKFPGLAACLTVLCLGDVSARAAELPGTWQAIFHVGTDQHLILKILPATGGRLQGAAYWPDNSQAADTTLPLPVSDIRQQEKQVSFILNGAKFAGTLSGDGNDLSGTAAGVALDFRRATPQTAWPLDNSTHRVRHVVVEKNIRLEVLDWGGTGRPLIFLPGLGFTAHEFDKLAPEFTATNHVYAITRRGFGNSSKPQPSSSDYSANRLGDDVLAVMKALKLDRPVLAGHSIAGEELSSIGSRHPEKVAGLVYLDAAYSYAYYSPGNVIPLGINLQLAARDLASQLSGLSKLPRRDQDLKPVLQDLRARLTEFEKDLSATEAALQAEPLEVAPLPPELPQDRIEAAVTNGARKYTGMDVPVLALFESPPLLPPNTPPEERAVQNAQFAAQADAFQAGLPLARVVRLPNARHALWMTNKDDVVREMNGFLSTLK